MISITRYHHDIDHLISSWYRLLDIIKISITRYYRDVDHFHFTACVPYVSASFSLYRSSSKKCLMCFLHFQYFSYSCKFTDLRLQNRTFFVFCWNGWLFAIVNWRLRRRIGTPWKQRWTVTRLDDSSISKQHLNVICILLTMQEIKLYMFVLWRAGTLNRYLHKFRILIAMLVMVANNFLLWPQWQQF